VNGLKNAIKRTLSYRVTLIMALTIAARTNVAPAITKADARYPPPEPQGVHEYNASNSQKQEPDQSEHSGRHWSSKRQLRVSPGNHPCSSLACAAMATRSTWMMSGKRRVAEMYRTAIVLSPAAVAVTILSLGDDVTHPLPLALSGLQQLWLRIGFPLASVTPPLPAATCHAAALVPS